MQVTFPKYSGANKTHPAMFKLLQNYYDRPGQPPVYLQHLGNSIPHLSGEVLSLEVGAKVVLCWPFQLFESSPYYDISSQDIAVQ